jgi:hypothetical protein
VGKLGGGQHAARLPPPFPAATPDFGTAWDWEFGFISNFIETLP